MAVIPKLDHREEQIYAGMRTKTTISELPTVIPQLHDQILLWLEKQEVKPNGPPFIKYYDVSEMDKYIDIELGWPVAKLLSNEGDICVKTNPAGRYATYLHIGDYGNMIEVTGKFLQWAEENQIRWQMNDNEWVARLEFYIKDPGNEPNPEKWETELAFLVADN